MLLGRRCNCHRNIRFNRRSRPPRQRSFSDVTKENIARTLPLIIMPAIPPAMIGVIALAGIVVRNSVVLIDFVRHGKEPGLSLHETFSLSFRSPDHALSAPPIPAMIVPRNCVTINGVIIRCGAGVPPAAGKRRRDACTTKTPTETGH